VDYKTGSIYENLSETGMQILRTPYRKQLLLYAAMHHWETETWPIAGHVIGLANEQETVHIAPVEAEQEARKGER